MDAASYILGKKKKFLKLILEVLVSTFSSILSLSAETSYGGGPLWSALYASGYYRHKNSCIFQLNYQPYY